MELSHRTIFNQIQVQDYISSSCANYAQQCGMKQFVEALDMSCGAIPSENFEVIIDPSAPEQFLKLYSDMAQSRLAFVITNMLEASKDFSSPIFNFVQKTGEEMNIGDLPDLEQALQVFQSVVLGWNFEDLKEEVQFLERTQDVIEWQGIPESVKRAWAKVKGNLENYALYIKCFCDGLFINSSIKLEIKEDLSFKITREELHKE